MNTISKFKVSDIPATTLRLPPELRDQLMRAATINGRSLNQEILVRLKTIADPGPALPRDAHLRAEEPQSPRYPSAANQPAAEGHRLSDMERMLLNLFSTLEPAKQLSLLTLLKR